MYCPKCKAEYREGYTQCAECGCPLTAAPPSPKEQVLSHPEPALLCDAANDFEADIIVSKLAAEGIRAFKRYRGADSYNKILLGRTILGVEILVAANDFDEAQNVLFPSDLSETD